MKNGIATPLFSVGRGVRQVDPLSPYLFILALESLLAAIKQNKTSQALKEKAKKLSALPSQKT